MNNKNFAFGKKNYIMMAISVVIVLIGFVLMSGSQSTETFYDPDVFSVRHIKVAPVICFIGYVSMIFAIIYRPKEKDNKEDKSENTPA